MNEFPNPCPGSGCFPMEAVDGTPLDTADGAKCHAPECGRLVALNGEGRMVDHSRGTS